MNRKWLIPGIILLVVIMLVGWVAGTYNGLVGDREKVKTAFSNLESAYQRRADLIPNLVSTVKGSSEFEQETLNQVVEARAQATSINVDADNPEDVQRFMEAQQNVSSSLGRLIATVENYPDIKSAVAYQDLMTQLEGTENRVNVARQDYNEVARPYNTGLQTFPKNLIAGLFGFKSFNYYEADEGAEDAPTVDFGTTEATN